MNSTARSARRRRRGAGFSLMELTLVIAIMGILMAAAAVTIGPKIFIAKTTATKARLRTLQSELLSYYTLKGSYPPTLQALAGAGYKVSTKDAWGHEFYYKVNEGATHNQNPYELISKGEDGQAETSDDVSVWDIERDAGA